MKEGIKPNDVSTNTICLPLLKLILKSLVHINLHGQEYPTHGKHLQNGDKNFKENVRVHDFTLCSSVSIANFKQVNAGWVALEILLALHDNETIYPDDRKTSWDTSTIFNALQYGVAKSKHKTSFLYPIRQQPTF